MVTFLLYREFCKQNRIPTHSDSSLFILLLRFVSIVKITFVLFLSKPHMLFDNL